MALYSLTNPVFAGGLLVSGDWTPSTPRLFVTSRETSKNRYTKYPVVQDDIDGTGTFVERVVTTTYQRVALTYETALLLQTAIEALQYKENDGIDTNGRLTESNRIVGSYTHEFTVAKSETKMVDWVEGQIEQEEV